MYFSTIHTLTVTLSAATIFLIAGILIHATGSTTISQPINNMTGKQLAKQVEPEDRPLVYDVDDELHSSSLRIQQNRSGYQVDEQLHPSRINQRSTHN